jgi:hypothetical protein
MPGPEGPDKRSTPSASQPQTRMHVDSCKFWLRKVHHSCLDSNARAYCGNSLAIISRSDCALRANRYAPAAPKGSGMYGDCGGSISSLRHIGQVTLFLCFLQVSNWEGQHRSTIELSNSYPFGDTRLAKTVTARELDSDLLFLRGLYMYCRIVFRANVASGRYVVRQIAAEKSR